MFFFFELDQRVPVGEPLKKILKDGSLTWSQLDRLLESSKEAKSDLTVGTLQTFLFVVRQLCLEEDTELTVKGVAEGIRAPYATVARHCDELCDGPRGAGGLGWLTKIPGSQPKTKCLHLTRAGHIFLGSVLLR